MNGPGCSMLCEPEKGIHRYVTPATELALERWRRERVGVANVTRLSRLTMEHGIVPGSLFVTVSVEPAVEMPPPEDEGKVDWVLDERGEWQQVVTPRPNPYFYVVHTEKILADERARRVG